MLRATNWRDSLRPLWSNLEESELGLLVADLRLSGYGQSVMNVARVQSEQELEVRERGRPSVIRMTAPGPKLMHWDRPISSSRMGYATSFASMRTRSDLTALTKAAWSWSV